jgi:hypothetical protein
MYTKYKHTFDKLVFTNRWIMDGKNWWRSGDYTLIGICRFGFSPTEYEWRLCFFGLEARIWMKREQIKMNS